MAIGYVMPIIIDTLQYYIILEKRSKINQRLKHNNTNNKYQNEFYIFNITNNIVYCAWAALRIKVRPAVPGQILPGIRVGKMYYGSLRIYLSFTDYIA